MLTYRHADATAYLDVAKGHEKSYHGILLCDSHAGRFTAPVGWTTVDRRERGADADPGFRVTEPTTPHAALVDEHTVAEAGSDVHAD